MLEKWKVRVLSHQHPPMLAIGEVQFPLHHPTHPELVPKILFHDIPNHLYLLAELLKDFIVGEKHLLLIGNQGVGKNKLADRLCQLLRREREYMQLHRDTTVQALTLTPTLRGGVMVYEDSALVRAVTFGRVLVVDEADKAPLEVVSILKGLVEDGDMLLADGRRIVSREIYDAVVAATAHLSSEASRAVVTRTASPPTHTLSLSLSRLICVHENFRLLTLANRPGFPFLGNDFFRECGDIFSCHVINNPDALSEMALLRSYGPSVPIELLEKLIEVFSALRQLVEDGVFAYPYSTRELVAIVRHLQQFPHDGLVRALHNVLSFDLFDAQLVSNLESTFHQHGIPVNLRGWGSAELGGGAQSLQPSVDLAPALPLRPPRLAGQWRVGSATDDATGDAVRRYTTSPLITNNPTAVTSPMITNNPTAVISPLITNNPTAVTSPLITTTNHNPTALTSSPPMPLLPHHRRLAHILRSCGALSSPSDQRCTAAPLRPHFSSSASLPSRDVVVEATVERFEATVERFDMRLKSRSWRVDLGAQHSVEHWAQGRFDRFTEERLSFQVSFLFCFFFFFFLLPTKAI